MQESPRATAGAGPSSDIASTIATNEPDIRIPRISIVKASLPRPSANSVRTRPTGCQSEPWLDDTASPIAAAAEGIVTSASIVRRVNTPLVIGTLPLALSLTTQSLDVLSHELE